MPGDAPHLGRQVPGVRRANDHLCIFAFHGVGTSAAGSGERTASEPGGATGHVNHADSFRTLRHSLTGETRYSARQRVSSRQREKTELRSEVPVVHLS